jgi:hypothetical protein
MFNCHKQLTQFHNERVSLTEAMKEGMRARRRANQKRLKDGLEKAKKPLPLRHVKQGSYAMHTMVQSEYDASDIDDGVVFAKAALVGPRGGEYSAHEAKCMVRDAIDDGSFDSPPEVRGSCVRIEYKDGFRIDVPVYREVTDGSDVYYELAAKDWKRADPEGVTTWFNDEVMRKSPDLTNGRQMRRMVKLGKAWSKSRKTWNLPSGLAFSTLIDEVYYKDLSLVDRDDQAFVQVLERIHARLQGSLRVEHPVVSGTYITKTDNDSNMVELRDRLANAIATLAVLRKSDCTELDALKVLRDFFATDFFDARIAELAKDSKGMAAPAVIVPKPTEPVIKQGGEGRYA